MKIVITGGHLTPALSLIDFIQNQHPQDKLIFVGRQFSQDILQQEAVEHYEITKRKVSFISFNAVRFGATFFRHFFKNTQLFLKSLGQAKLILKKHNPQVLVSFGGYLAVPFVLAAWLLHIPIVTHEQTLSAGWANRLIGKFAKKIAISFPQTAKFFPARKTVLTGNPLRAGVFKTRYARPAWLPTKISKPIILVMGGNQGSRAINEAIGNFLGELLTDWTIIHQCGRPTKKHNYLEILERQKKRLPKNLQQNYFIKEWLDEEELFWIYRHAFCAISRSGANATQELAIARVPSVLIPLPMAHGGEQHKNARWLVEAGGAILLEQSSLDASNLFKTLERLKILEKPMRENLAGINLPQDAAEQLYTVVTTVV
ncbi:MAG: UDP-N-acetylglucosamine--N-acetylmuramyl-(pentapeptide) pyrophosphoryl-undecaprenol N-acetylglucosamine transferase [Candidatus Paceibacterota bacterium]